MIEANLTREEARERAELISDLEYEVSLDLTSDEEGQRQSPIWVSVATARKEQSGPGRLNAADRGFQTCEAMVAGHPQIG